MFEQDRVLVRLQQRVLREDSIVVCFLTGSFGRDAQDGYSDLDVTLLFADDASRNIAFEGRREFIQSVLPYVPAKSFDAVHIRPYLHIALYANGAKVDYLYETQESLQPTPWIRDIRLLKDSDGWGERFQELCAQQPPSIPHPTISSQALRDLDDRFWVMFMDIYRLLLRGDHNKPFEIYLQIQHFTVPELLMLLPEEDPAHQALLRAFYNDDTVATAQHLRGLLMAYLTAREAIVNRHRLSFSPNIQFEREIIKLIERK